MKEFYPISDKAKLRRYVGSMSQLAGIRKCRLDEGRAQGTCAVDVRNGTGLEFTVLPDRGMDIAWTSYRGVPLSYISNAGVCSPQLYEAQGMEWLRGFYAGMLTTCGFQNVGGPCSDTHPVIGAREFSLHGRLAYTPAAEVATKAEWVDGRYVMTVSGKLTESIVHGENLTLRRTIRSTLGENSIHIHDVIENEDTDPQVMMLLYHMNVGYPVLDEGARLLAASREIDGADETARAELGQYDRFHAPVKGAAERCYFHKPVAGADGYTHVAVVNDALELGVSFSFKPEQLPCMTEWKMLNEGEYVLGIEPGNTHPIGRINALREGSICVMQPGEIRETDIAIRVLDGADAIRAAEARILDLRKEVRP